MKNNILIFLYTIPLFCNASAPPMNHHILSFSGKNSVLLTSQSPVHRVCLGLRASCDLVLSAFELRNPIVDLNLAHALITVPPQILQGLCLRGFKHLAGKNENRGVCLQNGRHLDMRYSLLAA